MRFDLTEILLKDGKIVDTTADLDTDCFSCSLGDFPIIQKDPVHLHIENQGKRQIYIQGETHLTIQIPCDRCLDPVDQFFSIRFEREAGLDQSESGETDGEEAEEIVFNESSVDIDQIIAHEILIKWPSRVLCKEDCKGICSQCGTNLNHGTCDCKKESQDPRMAAIQDIFSKFKEV